MNYGLLDEFFVRTMMLLVKCPCKNSYELKTSSTQPTVQHIELCMQFVVLL